MSAIVCVALWAVVAEEPKSLPDEPENAIVVTGERVSRSVRDTPSSVSVISQSEVEANGADSVDDVLALVPNLQLGNGSQGPAIRGLDSTGPLSALPAFLGGNRPRTTIIIDGRPVTYNELVFGTFGVWDVNRVEIFRSPQTTTQGPNSIAGAIFVNTNDPTVEPEYGARGIIGNYKMRQISALASGAIAGEGLAFRVAGDFRYIRTTSDINDTQVGADPNHDVYGQLRAKLLMKPGPDTRAVLTYSHTQSQAPQIVGVTAPFSDRRDEDGLYGVFRINVDSLTASVRHQIGSTLKLDLLLTGGDSMAQRFAFAGLGQTRNRGRDWTGELVVDWSPEGPLSVVGGISRTHLALKQFIDLSRLSGSIGRFRDLQDGTGAFADVELALSARAKLTAGIRYQRDRQKRKGSLAADTFTIPVDFVGSFHSWLPKVTLSYDFTPDFRLGAMVQKAYNPGGTTIRVDTGRPDNFDAESLWDYEVFARANLAGGRATATANIFYYDMRNAQRLKGILIFTPTGNRVGFANLFNVPKARTYGAEAELDWHADDTLSGKIAIGLLGSKVVKTNAESADWIGNEFDRSPHFSGAIAVDWKPSERLRLSAQLKHHSPYFTDPENTPQIRVSSGTSVDGRAEFRLRAVTLFAQVRNLFNALNMRDLGDFDDVTGEPIFGEAEGPRTIGVGIETRF